MYAVMRLCFLRDPNNIFMPLILKEEHSVIRYILEFIIPKNATKNLRSEIAMDLKISKQIGHWKLANAGTVVIHNSNFVDWL